LKDHFLKITAGEITAGEITGARAAAR